jgi:hypothetical protein
MVQVIGRAHTRNQRGRVVGRDRKRKNWTLKGARREGGIKIKSNILFCYE